MDTTILNDITIILGLSIFIIYICHKARLPLIMGFLLTGMLVGPHGFGLISALHEVELLAEIGIVLLLFAIGAEMSLKDLWHMRKAVLLGGFLQVSLTILVTFFLATRVGYGVNESIFIGFLISLSSTAIVLKLLQQRASIHSPHGRTILSILLFQDVIVVPMILVTPILAGVNGGADISVIAVIAKGIGGILLVIISAKWIVPYLLYQVTKTRNQEMFLLSIIVICLSVAWVTYSMGLSLALGAFLAGLIVSESEYSHQALGNIVPFRDIFMSFFFVSIGMLLDVGYFLQQPVLFVSIALGVLLMKSIIAGLVPYILGYPLRTSILVGLSLAQVGEFSFILSRFGVDYGLLDNNVYQLFLTVSILTMALTPFVISSAPKVADMVMRIPLPQQFKCGLHPRPIEKIIDQKHQFEDHLIIVGFGFNGKTVAKAATTAGIPYIIIDTNPETVRKERSKGENIYYGDATQEAVLEHADIDHARVMVIGISDPVASRRITWATRQLNSHVHIITRTRYLQEMEPLYDVGADDVIPEEFETTIEIFVRLMRRYFVPEEQIEMFTAEVRSDGYEMFRTLSHEPMDVEGMQFDLLNEDISSFRVLLYSSVVNKTLAELDLRNTHEVTVLAIRRDSETLPNPAGSVQLLAGDVAVLIGTPDAVRAVRHLFGDEE
ncbi:MAG: cation:proton antiporter domain-containing protein [Methanosarcinaceae archaeon]